MSLAPFFTEYDNFLNGNYIVWLGTQNIPSYFSVVRTMYLCGDSYQLKYGNIFFRSKPRTKISEMRPSGFGSKDSASSRQRQYTQCHTLHYVLVTYSQRFVLQTIEYLVTPSENLCMKYTGLIFQNKN